MVSHSREERKKYYCKLATHIVLLIKSAENYSLISVLNSSYSKTRSREKVCKFLFHCSAYAYVASLSMIAGLRCAAGVQWRFPYDDDHEITLKMALLFVLYSFISSNYLPHPHSQKLEYKIYMKAAVTFEQLTCIYFTFATCGALRYANNDRHKRCLIVSKGALVRLTYVESGGVLQMFSS
ncbi:hypothetical protein T08_16160, partial [Trichinella sp. T8]